MEGKREGQEKKVTEKSKGIEEIKNKHTIKYKAKEKRDSTGDDGMASGERLIIFSFFRSMTMPICSQKSRQITGWNWKEIKGKIGI